MDQKHLEEEILLLCKVFPHLLPFVPTEDFVYYTNGKGIITKQNNYLLVHQTQAQEILDGYLREFDNNQDFNIFVIKMEKMMLQNRKVFYRAIEHITKSS